MQLGGGEMLRGLLWTPGFHPRQMSTSKRVGRKKEGGKF